VSTPAALPLSRERILRCAVRIADRDGLDAASLRKVAAELGVHVTSLYNHVPTKEALLDGVGEELMSDARLPTGELPWEQWVREYVAAVAGIARQHPGAFAVLLRRPVQGPRANATFEAGLAAFHRAGMELSAAAVALKTVALAVLGCAAEQVQAVSGGDLRTDMSSLSPEEFPELHDAHVYADELDVLSALTEVLVAGLGQQVPRRRRRSRAVV
jgi:AcrR family transcriptional regulator